KNRADTSAIDEIKARVADFEAQHARIPSLTDLMVIVGIGLGVVGLAHAIAVPVAAWFEANVAWAAQFSLTSSFVWMVLAAATAGVGRGFTPARRYEGAGASRVGSLCLCSLSASIGMQMDLMAIFDRPWLFVLGAIWMSVHVLVLWSAAKLVRAPL